jgi:hypothetical protein
MSVSHNGIPGSMLFSESMPFEQEVWIQVMQAFGFQAEMKGVCFGLSHSARDAFLAGDFVTFREHFRQVNNLF